MAKKMINSLVWTLCIIPFGLTGHWDDSDVCRKRIESHHKVLDEMIRKSRSAWLAGPRRRWLNKAKEYASMTDEKAIYCRLHSKCEDCDE